MGIFNPGGKNLPGEFDFGRMITSIEPGTLCRWCKMPLVKGPLGKTVECTACDTPAQGDTTMMRAD